MVHLVYKPPDRKQNISTPPNVLIFNYWKTSNLPNNSEIKYHMVLLPHGYLHSKSLPKRLSLSVCIYNQLTLPFTRHKNIPPFFVSLRFPTTVSDKMISARKLIKMARKWQKQTNIKRKRIAFPEAAGGADAESCNTSLVAVKGHFVVYTSDQRRFVLPLEYLKEGILKELFRIAEEEFGLPRYGPITLPCDAAPLEYVIALIQHNIAKNLEKALVIAVATSCCASSSYLPPDLCTTNQQMPIFSF